MENKDFDKWFFETQIKPIEKDNKTQRRLIPLDDSFMKDKKTHDKVWSFLQINSYKTNDGKRFVYKTPETNANSIHKAISRKIRNSKGKETFDISLMTVRNTLKLYEKLGLIYNETIRDLYGNNVEVIILSQNFEYYTLIPLETLKYLVDTANENVIKVYAYLLNKYQYKQKENERYTFNLSELCAAIGYSSKSDNTAIMRNILKSLQNNHLIRYEESYYITENKTPIPIFILFNASLYTN